MLGALLAIEAAGGILIFFARLAFGSLPGLALHVVAGVALTFVHGLPVAARHTGAARAAPAGLRARSPGRRVRRAHAGVGTRARAPVVEKPRPARTPAAADPRHA